ncbi:MAG: hypothetical protein B6226_06110 [Candidatus Cloacimonetes bacterium 4572_65]|nr:MAG: hypothetical protein B6226_06110 [Candidatus Cloacimonetes bacterium 4572_65]
MNYAKKLEGKKVFFAPLELDDARKYMSWYNDFEMGFFLGTQDRVITEVEELEILKSNLKNGYNFVIVDKETKTPVGNCSLFKVDWVNRSCEMGMSIGNKSFWNKGLGTDAIELLLAFAFQIVNLNNVMLTVIEYNKRAIHIYEKAGFSLVGKRRELVSIAGSKYDLLVYDMLASEFKSTIITETIEKYKNTDKDLNKISLML